MTAWLLGRQLRIMAEGGDPFGPGLPRIPLLALNDSQQRSFRRLGPATLWDWLAGGFHADLEATSHQWTSPPE